MTIYVDELKAYAQHAQPGAERYFGSGKQSCHMWTDGEIEELHQFAERIGMRRAWFQKHPTLPHYDLTPSRRRLAVQNGATQVVLLDYMRQRTAKAEQERL